MTRWPRMFSGGYSQGKIWSEKIKMLQRKLKTWPLKISCQTEVVLESPRGGDYDCCQLGYASDDSLELSEGWKMKGVYF